MYCIDTDQRMLNDCNIIVDMYILHIHTSSLTNSLFVYLCVHSEFLGNCILTRSKSTVVYNLGKFVVDLISKMNDLIYSAYLYSHLGSIDL